eukprot:7211181-Ditylum_brightwellii.AAC.1
MVHLHHLVPSQLSTISKVDKLTFLICWGLVELPLVWDWSVLVLEHAPVEVCMANPSMGLFQVDLCHLSLLPKKRPWSGFLCKSARWQLFVSSALALFGQSKYFMRNFWAGDGVLQKRAGCTLMGVHFCDSGKAMASHQAV